MAAKGKRMRDSLVVAPQSLATDLVSVVIPCFNASGFIDSTLRSVLAQTHRNLQIVVVDDKSTDDSPAIVRRLAREDARIELVEMSCNWGTPGAPRNAGVRAARGLWVAFLDADDLWHPRKLEFQLAALKSTGTRVCSTQMRDLGPGEPVEFLEPRACRLRRITWRMQLIKYRTPTSSILARRELMLECPFKEELQFKAREDTDCFTRIHEYVPYSIKLEHPFLLYRVQASQISGNKWKMVARHLNMLKKYRRRSGTPLGARAYLFTATHFALAAYFRLFRRML
jgi:teichuronic acid biosynthesis glycosyltransferase TuaG